LVIQKYIVVPLSIRSGLIHIGRNFDSIQSLIRLYRNDHKITLTKEYSDRNKIAPNYNNLPFLNKVDVFEEVMTLSEGNDLQSILWLNSANSEMWLLQRNNFTTSLAVMSMVGYIIGLGDRHLSNILLSRDSGKILHIDFRDCFEEAMKREKYPEKIPFRLTRMFVKTMGVTGIEGIYRTTCEKVIQSLRNHSESILSLLEPFAFDPIFEYSNRTKTSNHSDDSNQSIINALNRIKMKLSGRDFHMSDLLTVKQQVDKLVEQATSIENLCLYFDGWCPFW